MKAKANEDDPNAAHAIARQSMRNFVDYLTPGYKFGWFNEDVCDRLDRFLLRTVAGLRPRMMLFAPPRHGKSELASRKFTPYALGKFPNLNVIATSYAAELAIAMSKDVQRVLDSERYRLVFPNTAMAPPGLSNSRWVRRADLFEIVGHGGSYRAAGVGGGITGMGGHILIIDDPIKDHEDAMSLTTRERVWNWYRSTLYPRQMPGGAGILLIMTRWNSDDLAGRLIEAERDGGDKWEIVSYPAIADDNEEHRRKGEALHPALFDLAALRQTETVVGPSAWSALYQQRPVSRSGGMFQRRWFGATVGAAPADAQRWRSWDLAATSGGGDWSVGVLMAKDSRGMFYVEHVHRLRGSPYDVRTAVIQHAETDGKRVKIRIPQDPGQAGKEQAQTYISDLAGWDVYAVRETGSKETRASPFSAQCEAGNVRLVAGPWVQSFLDELELFPAGAHDDQVDAVSGAFERLATGSNTMRVSEEAIRKMATSAPRRRW